MLGNIAGDEILAQRISHVGKYSQSFQVLRFASPGTCLTFAQSVRGECQFQRSALMRMPRDLRNTAIGASVAFRG